MNLCRMVPTTWYSSTAVFCFFIWYCTVTVGHSANTRLHLGRKALHWQLAFLPHLLNHRLQKLEKATLSCHQVHQGWATLTVMPLEHPKAQTRIEVKSCLCQVTPLKELWMILEICSVYHSSIPRHMPLAKTNPNLTPIPKSTSGGQGNCIVVGQERRARWKGLEALNMSQEVAGRANQESMSPM